jgi:hypothetical protein
VVCRDEHDERLTRTEGSQAVTEYLPFGAAEWLPCYCCGRSFESANMVRFRDHPEDGLCVSCVAWLDNASRPIVRRLNPVWKLPAFIRAWITAAR